MYFHFWRLFKKFTFATFRSMWHPWLPTWLWLTASWRSWTRTRRPKRRSRQPSAGKSQGQQGSTLLLQVYTFLNEKTLSLSTLVDIPTNILNSSTLQGHFGFNNPSVYFSILLTYAIHSLERYVRSSATFAITTFVNLRASRISVT